MDGLNLNTESGEGKMIAAIVLAVITGVLLNLLPENISIDLTEKEVEVAGVDENVSGIYYAVYESPTTKYGSVKLIRNIIVTGVED